MKTTCAESNIRGNIYLNLSLFSSETELNKFLGGLLTAEICIRLENSPFRNVKIKGYGKPSKCLPDGDAAIIIYANNHLTQLTINESHSIPPNRTNLLFVRGNPLLNEESLEKLRDLNDGNDSYSIIQEKGECIWKSDYCNSECTLYYGDVDLSINSQCIDSSHYIKKIEGNFNMRKTNLMYLPVAFDSINGINNFYITDNKFTCVSEKFRNEVLRKKPTADITRNALCDKMCNGPYILSKTNQWDICDYNIVWNGLHMQVKNDSQRVVRSNEILAETHKLSNISTFYGPLIIKEMTLSNLDFFPSLSIINMTFHQGPAIWIENNEGLNSSSLEFLLNLEIIWNDTKKKSVRIRNNGFKLAYDYCTMLADKIGSDADFEVDCAPQPTIPPPKTFLERTIFDEANREIFIWIGIFSVLLLFFIIIAILFINYLRQRPIELVVIRKAKKKEIKQRLAELANKILSINPLVWQNSFCEIGTFKVDIDFETDAEYIPYSDLIKSRTAKFENFLKKKTLPYIRVTQRENSNNKLRVGRSDAHIRDRDTLMKMVKYTDIILLGAGTPANFIRSFPIEKSKDELFELNDQNVTSIDIKCLRVKALDSGLIWYKYSIVIVKANGQKTKSKMNIIHWADWTPLALPTENFTDISLSMLQYVEKKKAAVMFQYYSGTGEALLLLHLIWNMVRIPDTPIPNDWIIDPLILLNGELKRTNCLNEGCFVYVLRVLLLWCERSGVINKKDDKFLNWMEIYSALIVYSNDNDEPCLDYSSLPLKGPLLLSCQENIIVNPHQDDYHLKKEYMEEEYNWIKAGNFADTEDDESSAYGYLIDDQGRIEGIINEKLQILTVKKEEMGKQIGYIHHNMAYSMDGQEMPMRNIVSAMGKRRGSDRKVRDLHDHVQAPSKTKTEASEMTKTPRVIRVLEGDNNTDTGGQKFAVVKRKAEVSKKDKNRPL